jgi:hypothetical protein
MTETEAVHEMHDRQVTLALQHLAVEVQPSDAVVDGLADSSSAVDLLRAFTTAAAELGVRAPASEGDSVAEVARDTLVLSLVLPESAELAAEFVAEPPDDDQMGVADFPQYLAAVGFLVAFLQTRFGFQISRDEDGTRWDLSIGKEALDGEQMDKVLGIANTLIDAGPPDQR